MNKTRPTEPKLPMGADLFGELQLVEPQPKTGLHTYVPGLLFVSIASLAALWLSEHYGPPAILMGLLIGLSLNFINADRRLTPGLNFASQTMLRWGIVLIGLRITFSDVGALGPVTFLAVIVIMIGVLMSGILAARLFKQDYLFGLLAGGATAICGASAALALWGLIGEKRVDRSQFTIVLLGITLASAFALTFYPPLASFMGLTDTQAGFLIGAAIHDVAQSMGAGFSYSDDAGEVATIVKLMRVSLLAPVLFVAAILIRNFDRKGAGGADYHFSFRQGLPWFVIGFLILAGVNSFFPVPEQISDIAKTTSSTLLLFAVVAAAITSNMRGLLSYGWRSFAPVIIATLTAFVLALAATQIL